MRIRHYLIRIGLLSLKIYESVIEKGFKENYKNISNTNSFKKTFFDYTAAYILHSNCNVLAILNCYTKFKLEILKDLFS